MLDRMLFLGAEAQRKSEILGKLPHNLTGCDEAAESFLECLQLIRTIWKFDLLLYIPHEQMRTRSAKISLISSPKAFSAFPASTLSASIAVASFESYRLSWDYSRSCRISMRVRVPLGWWQWGLLWARKSILWELWPAIRHRVHRLCSYKSYRARGTTEDFPIPWCDWTLSSTIFPVQPAWKRIINCCCAMFPGVLPVMYCLISK